MLTFLPAEAASVPVAEADVPVAATAARPADKETLKVFLRVKPFTREDLHNNENQGVLTMASATEVVLCPPKLSKAFKACAARTGPR